MITEIEIKIHIPDVDKQTFEAWLSTHAVCWGDVHHIEYYISNPLASFFFMSKDGYKDAFDFLRIRFSDKGDSVCFKHWYADGNTGELTYCDEYETQIQDGKTMLKLFQALGFTENITVKKKRTIYRVGDFEVVIDDVVELGQFIEIELVKNVDDVTEGLAKIYNFMRQLGIKRFRKMDRGYVSMLLNPSHDFGEEIILE